MGKFLINFFPDTTMVFNHQQLNEHHDYQEINMKCDNEAGDVPPVLPPKPLNPPIKPSNWQGKFVHNKENLFKIPQELSDNDEQQQQPYQSYRSSVV